MISFISSSASLNFLSLIYSFLPLSNYFLQNSCKSSQVVLLSICDYKICSLRYRFSIPCAKARELLLTTIAIIVYIRAEVNLLWKLFCTFAMLHSFKGVFL